MYPGVQRLRLMDDEYIRRVLELIPRDGISVWELHRLVYELEERGEMPPHSWYRLGVAVRSAELDAVIGYLKLSGLVYSDETGETIYRRR